MEQSGSMGRKGKIPGKGKPGGLFGMRESKLFDTIKSMFVFGMAHSL